MLIARRLGACILVIATVAGCSSTPDTAPAVVPMGSQPPATVVPRPVKVATPEPTENPWPTVRMLREALSEAGLETSLPDTDAHGTVSHKSTDYVASGTPGVIVIGEPEDPAALWVMLDNDEPESEAIRTQVVASPPKHARRRDGDRGAPHAGPRPGPRRPVPGHDGPSPGQGLCDLDVRRRHAAAPVVPFGVLSSRGRRSGIRCSVFPHIKLGVQASRVEGHSMFSARRVSPGAETASSNGSPGSASAR